MPKIGSKIAEIANILREIAEKLPKFANFSKSRKFSQKSRAIFAKIMLEIWVMPSWH